MLPYIVVCGGSYVGVKTAQSLAQAFSKEFRVLLIEKNSHFQHLFAFPRFAVVSHPSIDKRKAFIPYNPGTFSDSPAGSGSVVRAKVLAIDKKQVKLDRKIELDGNKVDAVPYEYLVIATGTKLTPPSTLPGLEKVDAVTYLDKHAEQVQRAQKIAVIGAGAVGVQMALDIKELFPEKEVTIIHSRQHVMNRFHTGLHEIIAARASELGVILVLGSRVKLPERGYPTDGSRFKIELTDGRTVESDFAVIATGQTPQSELVSELSPKSVHSSGFISTKKTMQIDDEDLPNVFVVGDIANTGAPKAARPGMVQADVVTKNIQHLRDGTPLEDYKFDAAAIHITLGIKKNAIFRNPVSDDEKPMVIPRDDGVLDMGIDAVWRRRGGGDNFHL